MAACLLKVFDFDNVFLLMYLVEKFFHQSVGNWRLGWNERNEPEICEFTPEKVIRIFFETILSHLEPFAEHWNYMGILANYLGGK